MLKKLFPFACILSLIFSLFNSSVPLASAAGENIGLHAASVEWLDSTHIRATYDWTDANQLLDWTGTAGVTLTRGASTVAITGGSTAVHAMRWTLPMAVSSVQANANRVNGTSLRIYTNMSSSWAGDTETSPLLGHVWHSGMSPFFKNNSSNITSGSPDVQSNTWNQIGFTTNATTLTAWNSQNGTHYTTSGSFDLSTSGRVALGGGGDTSWGTVVIEGEIVPSFDTTPPTITSIASSPSQTSAVITWTTNEASTSNVEYGATTVYGSTQSSATPVTAHSVTLIGLTANTTYHYRVSSADSASNSAVSSDYTFTTPVESSNDLGLHAASVEWLDSTHIRATYDWTDANQLLDWTGTAGVTLTRGASTVAITGGSTAVHAMRWTLPMAVSSVQANANRVNGTSLRIYTNMSSSWAGDTETSPLLGHVWHSGMSPFFKNNSSNITSGSPDVQSNTWNQIGFTTNATTLTAWNSQNGTHYTTSGSFDLSTSGRVALGGGGDTSWGTVVIEGEVTGSNPGQTDTTAPTISSIAFNPNQTSAIVSWVTDENTTSTVEYGVTSAYGSASPSSVLALSHSASLTGLSSNALYHFRISSWDASGNVSRSVDYTFRTVGTVAYPAMRVAVLGSSTAGGVGASDYAHAWAGLFETYLRSLNAGSSVVNLGGHVPSTYHALPTGTVPPTNRPYPDPAYNITAAIASQPNAIIINFSGNDEASGYSASETQANIMTMVAEATNAGIPVWVVTSKPRDLDQIGRDQLIEMTNWVNTTYGDHAIDFWTTVSNADGSINIPYSAGDGAHLNDAGHYIFYSRVQSGNLVSTIAVPDTTAPTISSIASTPAQTSATIAWTTNESASSNVQYGTTSAYGSSQSSATLVTSHSVSFTGLTASTTYHYRVSSQDAAGNTVTSADGTFMTTASGTSPGNLGLHAASVVWLDSTHIRATYDWTDANQLLDWTGTAGVTLTRGASTVAITGGSTGVHAMRWTLPMAVSSIQANANRVNGTSLRIYTNMSNSWTGNIETSPLLGHVWHSDMSPFFKDDSNNLTSGSSDVQNNTWNQIGFTANATTLTAWNSQNGTHYTTSGSFDLSTSGRVALGGGGDTSWGTVIIEGEVILP